MDYPSRQSFHATTGPSQHNQYPPSSHHIPSRSTTINYSNDSFVKRPLSLSDESNLEAPLSNLREKPADGTRRWYQSLFPKSMPIRLFLITVLLETIIDLAIQADIFSRLGSVRPGLQSGQDPTKRVALYLGIFAFAHVFQLVIAIEAVWAQNTLQFLFITILNLLLFVYSIIQSREIRQLGSLNQGVTQIPINVLTILAHVVIGVAELAFVGLGWQIWKEFGWKVYKFLGADRQIKRIYAHYQIFLCLLRFDLFFGISFSAQLIFFVLGKDDTEYYLTIAALPLSLLLLLEGHLAARFENKWLMGTFMLGIVAACVYFAYKLLRIWQNVNTTFANVSESLTLFASVSMFFLIATFIWGCVVFNNFGRGLKEQMSKKLQQATVKRKATTATLHNKHFPMSTNPNRMSIE